MLLRVLALSTAAALTPAASELPSTQVTGMLEYVSRTAVVVRLPDNREIQARIPGSMAELASGREVGDWVDLSYQSTKQTLDPSLNLALYAELTDIRTFRKPSASELASAHASPIRRFPGNLLAESPAAPAEEQSAPPDPFAEVRQKVKAYLAQIPSFIADEYTTRWTSTEEPPQWTQLDQIQTEIRFDGHHDVRTKILLNSKPWNRPYETLPGMKWRSGYCRKVHAVFSNRNIQLVEEGEQTLNGQAVAVYAYHAPADSITHWYLGEQGFWPALDGKVWISKDDGRALQLEESSTGFPPDFPLSSAIEHVAFDNVPVGANVETLPVASEVTWVCSDTGKMFLNKNTYKNYRAETASWVSEAGVER
ncbi:MAG TPA: hypothetical protein VHU83_18145 [Bryobacteraceae bacterium]|jgi:hypothetical protein|nr:hypothetical protein [Bryobacteraceae bacterium]